MTLPRTPMRWLFGILVLISLAAFFLPFDGGTSVIPDKLVHFVLFAALAGSGYLARFRLDALTAGLLAYAVTSEILQGIMPIQRSADWRDSVADSLGIAIGLLTARLLLAVIAGIGRSASDRSGVGDTPEHRR